MKLQLSEANFWAGPLPLGCRFCREGAKMVLYITGLCQSHCYYCPVSRDRMYTDVTFANERKVGPDDLGAVLAEAHAMKAKGAGITGGDPMMVPERVERYCRALKQEFGPRFHLHLYTQNVFDASWLPRLRRAGLDEIRFHPPVGWWERMDASPYDPLLRAALDSGLTVGCEVPALPYKEAAMHGLAAYLNRLGVAFLNFNELEFSEANIDQLASRGFELLNDESNVTKGSRDAGRRVVERCLKERMRLTVHFCASTYKDSVQLRKRLQRRATTVERPLDVATPDGTLLFGIVEAEKGGLEALYDRLAGDFEVPPHLLQVNRPRSRVEIAPWVLERLVEPMGLRSAFLVEVYPTANRLEVERTPLPELGDDWDDEEEDEDDVVDPDESSGRSLEVSVPL